MRRWAREPPLPLDMTLETAGSTTALTYATTAQIKTSIVEEKTLSKPNYSGKKTFADAARARCAKTSTTATSRANESKRSAGSDREENVIHPFGRPEEIANPLLRS